MKKTLFLHVGPHKTGTTLLQNLFLDNSKLLSENGLVYPQKYISYFGHHQFRDCLAKRELTQEDIDSINQTDKNLFLSSEDFISLNQSDFEYLRDILFNVNIVIIYAWRRSSLKMYSIWQEIVKHGGTQTFYEYYHEHLARPGLSEMLSPDIKLHMFANVFGKGNLKIIDYDASAKNKTLISDVLSIVNLPSDLISESENSGTSNSSLSSEEVELIRILNNICKRKYGIVGNAVRECIYENYNEFMSNHGNLLKEHIKAHMNIVQVGNYFIDFRADDQMNHHFLTNIVNYEKNRTVKKLKIPNTSWFFNEICYSNLSSFAEEIKNKLL